MARNFPAKKAKLWIGLPAFQNAFTVSSIVSPAGIDFTSPQTVIRMLGEYIFLPSSAPAAADSAQITVGIGKVSTDAFTLGSTAMPDPSGDVDYPWLYWAQHVFFANDTGVGSTLGAKAARVSFDIRSMRKFTTKESLVFVCQYADVNGAPPVTFAASQTRVLTTLH